MTSFSIRLLKPLHIRYVKILIWLLALLPFALLLYGVVNNSLGANPVEKITRSTGWWTLVFLCLGLSVTPLRRLLAWPWLARLRRLVGLFAFFYAVLHFTTWLWFDHFFVVAEMWKDLLKRPFITVGFAAFVLLIPLAATSTNGMVKYLGGKRWQLLHRLIYLSAVLGVLHFWWHKAGKNDLFQPLIFALVVTALLGFRIFSSVLKKRSAD